jgi:formylglycine-generating enzyme required for sulfatase activity
MGVVQGPDNRGWQAIGVVAFLVLFIGVPIALHFWAYIDGPSRGDLEPEQRTAAIKSALKRGGVLVFREAGTTAVLSATEIAHVGRSRCVGEHECISVVQPRRGFGRCGSVQTNLYCAFEIVDNDGKTAVAMVKTYRSHFHTPPELRPDDPEWLYETMLTERPDARTAGAKLCQMGYCGPGVFQRWMPAPRPAEPPDADAEARRACSGVLADIVGKGKTCVDVANPVAREFRDCLGDFCGPLMVAMPKGRYLRGSSDAEIASLRRDFPDFSDLGNRERPAREVSIDRHVAMGKLEVTFDEWDACRKDLACSNTAAGDEGWGRGKRPVINVSWTDIHRDYLPWLNRKLGLAGENAYRLPSDAEWEYAARAGTTTRYAFGTTITKSDARYFDGPLGSPLGRTAEVGSFAPNAFGLYDMHGNVEEWVEDCYSFMNDADDLPTDGSAFTPGSGAQRAFCSDHAFRGGSYRSGPQSIRSATRGAVSADKRATALGFRVARTLGGKR